MYFEYRHGSDGVSIVKSVTNLQSIGYGVGADRFLGAAMNIRIYKRDGIGPQTLKNAISIASMGIN